MTFCSQKIINVTRIFLSEAWYDLIIYIYRLSIPYPWNQKCLDLNFLILDYCKHIRYIERLEYK